MNVQELIGRSNALYEEAKAVYTMETPTAEQITEADRKFEDANGMQSRALNLKRIADVALNVGDIAETPDGVRRMEQSNPARFKDLAQYWLAVHQAGNIKYRGGFHPALGTSWAGDEGEKPVPRAGEIKAQRGKTVSEWEAKTLVENTGATGGFLVPTEFLPELLGGMYEKNTVRQRATIIPMRRRQINIPVLDQTGGAAGQSAQFGGISSTWTEEVTAKDETEPSFRQVQLTAHKLALYCEAGDELLDDSAIGLDAFFRSEMGFAGAINWQEEWTFLNGTGAGQPLGVLNVACGATFVHPRAVAGTIGVSDIVHMLMHHHGDNPVWHINRGAMATLLQMNGPAANPHYVFIPGSVVTGAPSTLFGYPIVWTEKSPILGDRGDILLADWSYYLVGDRQATTVDSTNQYRWRYDITSWRAVHRVDGQPWLSEPWTLADNATQISPFVILGDAAT